MTSKHDIEFDMSTNVTGNKLNEEEQKGDLVSNSTNNVQWKCCGDKLPKEEIVFFVQVIPIYTVILCSIVSLVLEHGDEHIWTVLLGSCLGYLLPNPSISRQKKKRNN